MFGLSMIWTKVIGAAIAFIMIFSAGTYAGIRWEKSEVQALQLQIAQNAAAADKATVQAIQKSVADALAANNAAAQRAAEREQKTAALIERLSHVPPTSSCVRSPAISTYLDGLRNGRTGIH